MQITWGNEKNQSLFLRDPNLIFTAKSVLYLKKAEPGDGSVCVLCEPSLSLLHELTVYILQWLPSPFCNRKVRFIWLHLHSSHPPQPRALVLTVLLPRAIFRRHQHNQVSLLRCLLINEAVPGFLIKDKLPLLHPFTLLCLSSARLSPHQGIYLFIICIHH